MSVNDHSRIKTELGVFWIVLIAGFSKLSTDVEILVQLYWLNSDVDLRKHFSLSGVRQHANFNVNCFKGRRRDNIYAIILPGSVLIYYLYMHLSFHRFFFHQSALVFIVFFLRAWLKRSFSISLQWYQKLDMHIIHIC